jgi:hypothetical protein
LDDLAAVVVDLAATIADPAATIADLAATIADLAAIIADSAITSAKGKLSAVTASSTFASDSNPLTVSLFDGAWLHGPQHVASANK